jgi:hypothetical protein
MAGTGTRSRGSRYVQKNPNAKKLGNRARGTVLASANVQNSNYISNSMTVDEKRQYLVDIVRTGNAKALKAIADDEEQTKKILITERFTEKYSPGNKTLLHFALEQYVKDPKNKGKQDVFMILEKRIYQLNEEKRINGVQSRIMPFSKDKKGRHLLHTFALHRSGLTPPQKDWLDEKLGKHLDPIGADGQRSLEHALKALTRYDGAGGVYTVRNILHHKGYHENAQNLTPASMKNRTTGQILHVSPLNERTHTTRASIMMPNGKTPLFKPRNRGGTPTPSTSSFGRRLNKLSVNSNNEILNNANSGRRRGRNSRVNGRATKPKTTVNSSQMVTNNVSYSRINASLKNLHTQALRPNVAQEGLGQIYNTAQGLHNIAAQNRVLTSNQKNTLKAKAKMIQAITNARMSG